LWDLLEYSPFFAGVGVSLLNFYLSFLRIPILRLRGREGGWVSGLPVVGSGLLAWFAIWHLHSPGWFWAGVAFAAIDTGGLHWFAAVLLWYGFIRPCFRDRA
jgi:hypothetical protein